MVLKDLSAPALSDTFIATASKGCSCMSLIKIIGSARLNWPSAEPQNK